MNKSRRTNKRINYAKLEEQARRSGRPITIGDLVNDFKYQFFHDTRYDSEKNRAARDYSLKLLKNIEIVEQNRITADLKNGIGNALK